MHAAVMSSNEAPEDGGEDFFRTLSIERRSKLRFPLELRVNYQTVGRGVPLTGTGFVVEMSSSGLWFAGNHEITVGRRMKLTVEWPALLDGKIPLQLAIDGKVVRCSESGFAVELREHQFRTCKRAVTPIDASYRAKGGPGVKKLPRPYANRPAIRAAQTRRPA